MLATRDAAPDIKEILTLFHFWRRRRMVGTNSRDVAKQVAKLPLLIAGSKRRRALSDGAKLFHVLVGEHQVMRTSLTGHIDSGRTSLGDKRNAGSAAHMNDV